VHKRRTHAGATRAQVYGTRPWPAPRLRVCRTGRTMFHWSLALGPASTGDATTLEPPKPLPGSCRLTAALLLRGIPIPTAAQACAPKPCLHSAIGSIHRPRKIIPSVFPSRPARYPYHTYQYQTTPITPIPSDPSPTLHPSIDRCILITRVVGALLSLLQPTRAKECTSPPDYLRPHIRRYSRYSPRCRRTRRCTSP
jgi:hypothetical protein